MTGRRTKIPKVARSRILVANQHACCVCGKGDVQIHHIDSDPSNHDAGNLAVLCLGHHDKATAPIGLTARLTPGDVASYKSSWEARCAERLSRVQRSRTAFFMVDYKNAERIRQLFGQLTNADCKAAHTILCRELVEEEVLRNQQKFDRSMEPNTRWDSTTKSLLSWIVRAEPHPKYFHQAPGHPKDRLYPTGGNVEDIQMARVYDRWCQIMVRAILAIRPAMAVDELLALPDPKDAGLSGSLLTFAGAIRGSVPLPSQWKKEPTSKVELRCVAAAGTVVATLAIKTHYVYSDTAAFALSKGAANGVLVLRGVEAVTRGKAMQRVEISGIPLMMGSGVLKM